MKNYIQFLKNNNSVAKLSLIQLISYFGAWFSSAALYTVLSADSSYVIVITILALLHYLPPIIQVQLNGYLIDRFDTKKLMSILLIISIITTFLFIPALWFKSIVFIFILVYIKMSASSLYFASEMSIIPKLLNDQKSLRLANDIHSAIWSLSFTFGITFGGLCVYFFGSNVSFIIDGLMFLLAYIVFRKIKFSNKSSKEKLPFIKMSKDTLVYLINNKKIIKLIVLHSCVGLTAFDSLVTFLANNTYKYTIAVSLSIGIMSGARGLALILGPLLLNKITKKYNLSVLILLQGIFVILWSFLQYNFYLSVIGMFFVGFWTTSIWSITYAMIQTQCDAKYLGRVISYTDMFFMFLSILTVVAIGILIKFGISIFITTIILGCGFLLFYIFSLSKDFKQISK
jgi:MFS family permease